MTVTTDDAVKLAVAFDTPAGTGPFPTVLLLHGYGSSKDNYDAQRLVPLLMARGIAVARFDFRGCGDSGGELALATVTTGQSDLTAVMDWLQAQPLVDQSRLGILGHSYGGLTAALYLETHHDFTCAVLKAPALDWAAARIHHYGAESIAEWRTSGFREFTFGGLTVNVPYSVYEDMQRYDLYERAFEINCPLLLFHGDADLSVPYQQSQKFAQLVGARAMMHILAGADHRFTNPAQHAFYTSHTIDFLSSHV